MTRLEPVIVLLFVLHAGYVWMTTETGVWEWSIAGILFVVASLGAAGVVDRTDKWPLVRGGLMLATLILVGELAGGTTSSPLLGWFGALAVVYPLVMPSRQARFVGLVVGGAYFAVSYLGAGSLDLVTAMVSAGAFLGAGVTSYVIGHVVLRLRVERDRVVSRLQQAEGTLNAAFATSSSGMAVLDLKGAFKTVNRALSDLLQVSGEWLLTVSLSQVVHPDDLEGLAAAMRQLIEGEVWSAQREVRLSPAEGRVAHALIGLSVVAGVSGRPEHLFAQVTDISERVRTEARVRVSEANYRTLFERSPVAIWQLDLTDAATIAAEWSEAGLRPADHVLDDAEALDRVLRAITVLNVNDAARSIFGAATRVEFADAFRDGRLGDGHRVLVSDLLHMLDTRSISTEREAAFDDLVGSEHPGEVRILMPTVDDELDLSGVVVAFVDASDKHRAEAELERIEQRLGTVMSSVPIVLFVVDQDGVFTMTEGQGLSALRQVPGEAVGRSAFEVFRDSESIIRNLRRALGGEGFTGVDQIGNLTFETRYSPMWRQGRVEGVIGVAYDITERVRATERLQELVRSKDEFVATVSHELRTPLTAVVGFAAELAATIESLSVEDAATYVNLIGEQAIEVSDLVEDLLVASRSEQGEIPVDLKPVDLWAEIEAVLSVRSIDREVEVKRGPENALVSADAMRVRQIFRNLITNAERYGGPQVTVEMGRTPDMWTLYVSDDGPGIARQHRATIFEPYHRAHRTTGRTESVGLGLTVSRQLARLMGGDLTYDFVNGRSIFALSLPAVGASVPAGPRETADAAR